MHTLLFFEPAHFHAALVLRIANPRVSRNVHVYASPGPEREAFLRMIDAFNARERDPAGWSVQVHEGSLELLIEERRGDAVVLAGRNNTKLDTIVCLHAAGFHVLADKPWLTNSAQLESLEKVTAGPPLAMDIMTGRHDVLARLRQRVVTTHSLFGGFVQADAHSPAIELTSVHHLYKRVNGKPLRRPEWYYDVAVQGDGMVDIQSHMADQVQWLAGGDNPGYQHDVLLDSARRWDTPVNSELYRDSTGSTTFPGAVEGVLNDGVLLLDCNGEIEYRLCGITARQRAEWRQREPAGAGDMHSAVVRGRRSRLVLRQDEKTDFRGELYLIPEPGPRIESELNAAVTGWQVDLPGLRVEAASEGYRFVVPPELDGGHESHFALVLNDFLDDVDAGVWPQELAARIRLRYTLLARARELALRGEASN